MWVGGIGGGPHQGRDLGLLSGLFCSPTSAFSILPPLTLSILDLETSYLHEN